MGRGSRLNKKWGLVRVALIWWKKLEMKTLDRMQKCKLHFLHACSNTPLSILKDRGESRCLECASSWSFSFGFTYRWELCQWER